LIVGGGSTPRIEIDEDIIKAIKRAGEIYGYDVPETDDEWKKLINDLLREKIEEDYGFEVFD